MVQQGFSVMHGWMMDKIDVGDVSHVTIAELCIDDLTPYDFRSEEPLNAKQLSVIKEYMLRVSYLESIRLQFLGFRAAIEAMINFTSLDEEGRFSIQNGITEAMAAINTLFSNILVDGNRMINSCERTLKKMFGAESDKYNLWKEATHYLYDNDLIYMLSCKLRNIYEHETLVLNYTSIDIETQCAYAVIDLEHELLGKDIPTTHTKMTEFIEYRKLVNGKPKRNIGTFMQTYFTQVQCLYTLYVFVQVAQIEAAYADVSNCFQLDVTRDNCVVIRDLDKRGFPELGVIYIRSIEEIRSILILLDEQGKRDLSDLMDRIEASKGQHGKV